MLNKDRFAGCLIGQAVGDAMGFVVEGHPPTTCSDFVNEALRPQLLEGYSRGPFPIGQYSDDTQLARELAHSFVKRGGFDPVDYADRIASLFTEDRIVGRGQATEQAANFIAIGIPWDEAGTPPPSAGNGSAMRAAPVGLLYAHDPAAMVKAAHDQGRITHQDSRCSAGSIVIAGAVALVLREEPFDPSPFCNQLAEWAQPYDTSLSVSLERLPALLSDSPHDVVEWVRRVGVTPNHEESEWEGISPFVTGSVLWSIYSFLRSPDDFWEAICTAIAVGGDVDTTAAMTGAIAGARMGLNGIPADAAHLITDQGTWEREELTQLAYDLHQLHVELS